MGGVGELVAWTSRVDCVDTGNVLVVDERLESIRESLYLAECTKCIVLLDRAFVECTFFAQKLRASASWRPKGYELMLDGDSIHRNSMVLQ